MPVITSMLFKWLQGRSIRILDAEHEAFRKTIPWPIRWFWKKRYRSVTFAEYFVEVNKKHPTDYPPLIRRDDGRTSSKETR